RSTITNTSASSSSPLNSSAALGSRPPAHPHLHASRYGGQAGPPVPLTPAAPLRKSDRSARWGATCPRQGSQLPPTRFDRLLRTFFRPDLSGRQATHGRRRLVSSLDNLRKTARRWLKGLREGDADARARLVRAYPGAPARPALRDVQHALAREHGHESWIALKRSIERENARAGRSTRCSPRPRSARPRRSAKWRGRASI